MRKEIVMLSRHKYKPSRLRRVPALLPMGLLAVGLFAAPAGAQTQTPQDNGGIPLGPPPTGQQAPLPAPALPLPKADKPVKTSPGLNALSARLQTQPLTLNEAVAIALATNRSLALAGEALLR